MTTKTPYYLTTAIYYANAAPHIGHAYEVIGADVIARFRRLMGHNVFFLTGTDEHGMKVEKTAAKHNVTPQEYVDGIAAAFQKTWAYLGVTQNRFIRTTEPDHYRVVSALWKKLLAQGDIYKATYTGLYCAGCEAFLLERDLTEGVCPNHGVAPEPVEEENYFFRLSKYRDAIRAHIETHPDFLLPQFRRTEVLNQLDDLEDISVSRSRRSVSWGIPVPDDEDQVIYVWIDALSNYITGIGWGTDSPDFDTYWPADVHVIGKDILRFHAIYWPAILMAAGLELPKSLLVHGFITVSDTKIGKSLGNVIAPEDLAERFSLKTPDPIRYYMMSTTGFGSDGSYTDDDFKLKVNADLANNLGNLVNRTLNMLNKYCEGKVPTPSPGYTGLIAAEDRQEIADQFATFQFHEALARAMALVDKANKLVNDSEPWTLFKEGKLETLGDVLYAVLDTVREVAVMLSPVMPIMSQEMLNQLGYTLSITDLSWEWLSQATLPAGQATQLGEPLLLRLDSEIVGAGKKK